MDSNQSKISDVVNSSHSKPGIRVWVQRLYVPLMVVVLVWASGHWLARADKVDPLTAAQNSRIKFKLASDANTASRNNLSDVEAEQAAAILTKDRRVADDSLKVLYLGNSQTLAIMDEQPGDLTTPQWFQLLWSRRSETDKQQERASVILGSEPNMTMPEVLIKLVAAGEQSPRQCDVLMDAAVLEEYRGLGIREQLVTASVSIKDKLATLVKMNPDLPAAAASLASLTHEAADKADENSKGRETFAQRLEQRVQAGVESNSLFARRGDLQAQIGIKYSVLRNQLLRIDSSTLRPVPESSYRASLELLELGLRYARSKGIHVVLYLAPLRSVQPNPNVPADVAKFRRDVPALCSRYDALCLDYVDLVPETLWTNYSDDPAYSGEQRDFAHFTGGAHKLVAEKLINDITPQIRIWEQQRSVARR